MRIFILESFVLCVLFTVMVVPAVRRNPLAFIDDYPPAIVQRARQLGLIVEEHRRMNWRVVIRKSVAALGAVLVMALVLRFLNGLTVFLDGFLVSYGLWLVVTWYDALVLDGLWFCHSKKVRLPGTEDMVSAYHDIGFHLKASAWGSLLGVPLCAVVGLLVALLG